jgi:elongator complex protein 3
VQLGVQSVNEQILARNQRGHTVHDVYNALRWLRLGGFKIVLHWMPNLFGATLESDLVDFRQLWEDPGLRPDEIKIYPTTLLEDTPLYDLWQQGKYQPYPEEALIDLLMQCKQVIPPYCRINRMMRDIPAQYIVAGTTKSNLRQVVQQRMRQRGMTCECIRCREIRGKESVSAEAATFDLITYSTPATQEYFLQYVTPHNHLAGFLRLSLPLAPRDDIPLPEIRHVAMIRELHVYGPALELGQRGGGGQHRGLGSQLLEKAAGLARAQGFKELAVIAAAGTRTYYRERGFSEGTLYLIRSLGID